MKSAGGSLTGVEREFGVDEIIVSKTDLTGKITYVNEVFVRVSQYSRAELMGAAHSIIRHPQMPRCIFQYMWDTIQGGHELFAYVVNRCRSGDHYWVLAHITPTFDASGKLVGYHSNRRCPARSALPPIQALYAELLRAETGYEKKRDAVAAGMALLTATLQSGSLTYDEYVWSL
jgi:PAS domain S-box-containing protein